MVYDLAISQVADRTPMPGVGVLPRTPHAYGAVEYGYRTKAGMGTVPTRVGWGSLALTSQSGTVWINFFRAPRTQALTRWDVAVATAAGATPSLIRGGLYLVDDNDNLTQLAASVNDTSLLSTAGVKGGKAFTTSPVAYFGLRYAFAWLWISAASAPTVLGQVNAGGVTHFAMDSDPRVTAVMIGAQTDLPASITAAQLNSTNLITWSELS